MGWVGLGWLFLNLGWTQVNHQLNQPTQVATLTIPKQKVSFLSRFWKTRQRIKVTTSFRIIDSPCSLACQSSSLLQGPKRHNKKGKELRNS